MTRNRLRIVLTGPESRRALDALAYRSYWVLDEVVKPGPDRPLEVVWRDEDDTTSIHYIEDALIDLTYVVIAGPNRAPLAAQIRAAVPTVSPTDVAERVRAAATSDERIRSLYLAAAAAPEECEPVTLGYFETAFRSSDPEVRKGAVYAVAYTEWRELLRPLEELRSGDADPSVREYADRMIEGFATLETGA